LAGAPPAAQEFRTLIGDGYHAEVPVHVAIGRDACRKDEGERRGDGDPAARREAAKERRDAAKDRRDDRKERIAALTPAQREAAKAHMKAYQEQRKLVHEQLKAGTIDRKTAAEQLKAWREANKPAKP